VAEQYGWFITKWINFRRRGILQTVSHLAQKNDTPQLVIDSLTNLAFTSVQNGRLIEAQQYSEQL